MLKKQTVTKIELLYGIAFYVLLMLVLAPGSCARYAAWYNSKNPENILDGCLYYIGTGYKGNKVDGNKLDGFYLVKIENFTESNDISIISYGSPIANDLRKQIIFFRKVHRESQGNKKKCYRIKYVTGRFSYIKKAYLYDVVE